METFVIAFFVSIFAFFTFLIFKNLSYEFKKHKEEKRMAEIRAKAKNDVKKEEDLFKGSKVHLTIKE